MKICFRYITSLALGLILFTVANGHAQINKKKVKVYKVWVKHNDGLKEKGFLYQLDNSALKVINTKSLNEKSKI